MSSFLYRQTEFKWPPWPSSCFAIEITHNKNGDKLHRSDAFVVSVVYDSIFMFFSCVCCEWHSNGTIPNMHLNPLRHDIHDDIDEVNLVRKSHYNVISRQIAIVSSDWWRRRHRSDGSIRSHAAQTKQPAARWHRVRGLLHSHSKPKHAPFQWQSPSSTVDPVVGCCTLDGRRPKFCAKPVNGYIRQAVCRHHTITTHNVTATID